MKSGIYKVSFSAAASGAGIVVIKDGKVNGGDYGFVFTGDMTSSGDTITAAIRAKRWDPKATSIFGPLSDFQLSLSGQANDAQGRFVMGGHIVGQPSQKISISGDFLSAAA
jgi:hypothetical protein